MDLKMVAGLILNTFSNHQYTQLLDFAARWTSYLNKQFVRMMMSLLRRTWRLHPKTWPQWISPLKTTSMDSVIEASTPCRPWGAVQGHRTSTSSRWTLIGRVCSATRQQGNIVRVESQDRWGDCQRCHKDSVRKIFLRRICVCAGVRCRSDGSRGWWYLPQRRHVQLRCRFGRGGARRRTLWVDGASAVQAEEERWVWIRCVIIAVHHGIGSGLIL